jgi:NTP pyrophosphatase (non-canonical NTP hydrolase)
MIMELREYQKNTNSTWNLHPEVQESQLELLNAAMGLAGEAGELVDLIKKHVFHHVPADPVKVMSELGDVLYYLTRVATSFGFSMDEVSQRNGDKLAARYPHGFVPGGGKR